jgi:hypothetical protein
MPVTARPSVAVGRIYLDGTRAESGCGVNSGRNLQPLAGSNAASTVQHRAATLAGDGLLPSSTQSMSETIAATYWASLE